MPAQTNNPAPKLDRAAVAAIWEAHALGPLDRIAPIAGGVRNTSYLVNDELVLRLNTHDPEFPKFSNERIAYDLLVESGLPLPRVVVLDETRALVPYDFTILTRVPGVSIASSRAALNPSQSRTLAWQSGNALARIHHYTFAVFGPLHKLAQQPFLTWQAYFDDYTQRYMQAAERAKLIDDVLTLRLETVQQGTRQLMAQVRESVLVHSDFHYENLLQQHGELSGVLDFEWALAGDPAADFAAAHVRAAMLPGSEAAFVAGYHSARPFDAEHSRRAAIYRLFLWLEGAVVESSRQNRAGAAASLAQMVELLAEIERRAQF